MNRAKCVSVRCAWLALLVASIGHAAQWGVRCSVSTSGLAFGIYNPLSSSPTYANATVTTRCWRGNGGGDAQNGNWWATVPFTLTISAGNSGTYSARSMLAGGNALSYNIFTDATYSVVAGDGTGGSAPLQGRVSLSRGSRSGEDIQTVYGRMAAAQNAAPGTYHDTLLVTVNY